MIKIPYTGHIQTHYELPIFMMRTTKPNVVLSIIELEITYNELCESELVVWSSPLCLLLFFVSFTQSKTKYVDSFSNVKLPPKVN